MFNVNARKIRELMFSQQLNISELAKKSHLQNASISRLTRDGSTANSATIGKVAAALGIDGEELILKED